MTDTAMALSRRGLLAAGLAAGLVRPGRAQAPIRAQDLLGRDVVLPRPAQRIILGSGRHLAVLNLLHPDPASLLVAWGDDLRNGQAGEYQMFLRRAPGLANLPTLGRGGNAMPAENVLALRPDLVLLNRQAALEGNVRAAASAAPAAPGQLMRTLEAAGIPVAVIDFFQQPLADTIPSLLLLGRLLGRDAQAADLVAFYEQRLARLRALDIPDKDRPVVFMHAHAGGLDCCSSPGHGTFDDFIRLAGGHNIGADKLPGVVGQLGLEYVLSRDPDVYIATGGPYGGRGGVSLGAGVPEQLARDSLVAMLKQQHLDGLRAVRTGHGHALWHGFNDSPTSLLAIEVMARWLHPARAGGIDPADTLRTLNERFAAVPLEGTYWTSLPST